MKKITFTLFVVLLSSMFLKAQTIGLTGPATSSSLDDITLVFTGETNAKYIVSAYLDGNGSSYNTNYMALGDKSFVSKIGSQGAKKVVQAVFLYPGYTNDENVTFKIVYSYNGSGGAGTGVLYKTVSISPPPIVVPPVVDPTIPTSQDLAATLGANDPNMPLSSVSNFSISTMPLLAWTINKGISGSAIKVYAQASYSSTFATVLRSEELAGITGYTHGAFSTPANFSNGWIAQPGFNQGAYFRTKLVYKGVNYYSNVIYVAL